MAVLIVLACIAAAAGLAGLLHGWFGRNARALRATRAELRRHKAFVEHARVTAYNHLEVDPNLATVLLDDIRAFNAKTPLELL